MDEVETWVSIGEAARFAGRDKTTIRRWVDQHLVTGRRSATGHRQVLLSSLKAVLAVGNATPRDLVDPAAGRVMFERWLKESRVLVRWVPDRKVPISTLENWREQLAAIEDVADYLRGEFDLAMRTRDY